MRKIVVRLSIFGVAFLVGLVVVWPTLHLPGSNVTDSQLQSEVPPFPVENYIAETNTETPLDWHEDDESKFTIKLLETGEGFHGDEVVAKTGQTWLGLFKENNKYFLRNTKIQIRTSHDPVVDAPGEITGKDVIVRSGSKPIFLLKNANMLRSGEVTTLFHAPELEDGISLQNGFAKDYRLNERTYRLRVEGESNTSTLVLESEGATQVLFHVPAMGDATWELLWVGDLDGDGKLDIYANLPTFYNFIQYRLFLSSQARDGKMLKQVAMFHITGC